MTGVFLQEPAQATAAADGDQHLHARACQVHSGRGRGELRPTWAMRRRCARGWPVGAPGAPAGSGEQLAETLDGEPLIGRPGATCELRWARSFGSPTENWGGCFFVPMVCFFFWGYCLVWWFSRDTNRNFCFWVQPYKMKDACDKNQTRRPPPKMVWSALSSSSKQYIRGL